MKNDLKNRLEDIRKVFSINKILARNEADPKAIARYYRKNRLAYRLFNSHQGFVHMGISEGGTFSKSDFYKQAEIVETVIQNTNAQRVLELAPGKGATINYLARRHPDVKFYGIDLKRGQLKKQNARNLNLNYGDYHDLSAYANGSMDVVYIIEALCHSPDKARVINEVKRVLRADGSFIIIDGYFSANRVNSEDEALACRLVASSMMVVNQDLSYQFLIKELSKESFKVLEMKDYSKNIMPSLRRLESKAIRFFRRPRAARLITLGAGEIVTANAIAGYLMPICVKKELFQYCYTLAQKH
jgi:ubiquinone/menaquinone biosynthesis C-methylase UbiE